MKDINILHLSDIHFGMEKVDNKITSSDVEKRNLILSKISSNILELGEFWKPDIIAISGDIGWKASVKDYNLATNWINELLGSLKLKSEDIILCPGNHDINRKIAKTLTLFKDSKIADEMLSNEMVNHFCVPFMNYTDFCMNNNFVPFTNGRTLNNSNDVSRYLFGYRIYKNICFIGLNSAWCCRGDSDSGNLWLGLPNLINIESLLKKESLSYEFIIALFHHPKIFLNRLDSNVDESRMPAYDKVINIADVILNGHIHAKIRNASNEQNKAFVFTSGATFQPSNYTNEFQIIHLSEKEHSYSTMVFSWKAEDEKWEYKNLENNIKLNKKKM